MNGRVPVAVVALALAVALALIGAVDDYYQHSSLTAGPAVLLAGIKTYGLAILAALAVGTVRRPTEVTP